MGPHRRAGLPVGSHALVLEAAQGRRFGGDKLLVSFQGRPLLSCVRDVVVTGCSAVFSLRLGLTTLANRMIDRSIWTYAHQPQGDRGFATLFPSALISTVTIDVPGDNPDVDTRADLHALEESSP